MCHRLHNQIAVAWSPALSGTQMWPSRTVNLLQCRCHWVLLGVCCINHSLIISKPCFSVPLLQGQAFPKFFTFSANFIPHQTWRALGHLFLIDMSKHSGSGMNRLKPQLNQELSCTIDVLDLSIVRDGAGRCTEVPIQISNNLVEYKLPDSTTHHSSQFC
jgi:hypothetical protein